MGLEMFMTRFSYLRAPRLRFCAPAFAFAAIFAASALMGAAPARAQAPQEDTNPLNSVLGFVGMQFDKEKEDIDYRARAPLVVPPKFDLPEPKQAARDPNWPKDPDIEQRRHAAAAAQRPAPQITPNTRAELSPQELAGASKSQLPTAGPPDDCQASAGTPVCLYAPIKALQQATGLMKPDSVVVAGEEPPRTYLTEPPPGYRKASATTSSSGEAVKTAPDAADPGAYIRSQAHKTSVDDN